MNLFSKVALLISIFLLPFSYIKLVSNFSISDLFFSISFFFILFYQFKNENSIREILNDNIFLFSISIYSFGFLISYNNSISPLDSFFSFLQILFIFIVVYYSLSLNPISEVFIKNSLYLLAILSSVVTLFIFIFYLTGTDYSYGLFFIKKGWGMRRFSYGSMEPNIAARIMAQNIPIILFVIFNSKKIISKFLNIILLTLLFSVIILTASRSGLLIVLLGIICYFIFNLKLNKKYNIFQYLFYSGLLVFSLFYFYNVYPEFFESAFNRYSTIFDYNFSASSKERLFVLNQSFNMINQSPIIGQGMGNSANLTGTVVHNPMVVSWLENGVFGFIGFLSIYIILIYYILMNYRNYFFNNQMLMILSVITIMMIFGDMFMANSYKRALWVPAIIFITYSNQTIHFHGHKKHIDK